MDDSRYIKATDCADDVQHTHCCRICEATAQEMDKLRAVVEAAMKQRDEPCCTEDHCGVCSAVDTYREAADA